MAWGCYESSGGVVHHFRAVGSGAEWGGAIKSAVIIEHVDSNMADAPGSLCRTRVWGASCGEPWYVGGLIDSC